MTSLLVLLLFLALLFGQAAAMSPPMEPSMSVGPMQSFYPDPDGILEAICELCGISINYCTHAITNHAQSNPNFTEATFYNHPEWPHDPTPGLEVIAEPEMPPLQPSYFDVFNRRPPLLDDIVRELDNNATTIQPSTIQIHIEGTYNPGDRIAAGSASRRPPNRRQAPRPGGFSCTFGACKKAFDRSCDLKRHQKTHLERSERPHKCSFCSERFHYPKDRIRHERTHESSSSPQDLLYCNVPGCNSVAFSRRDNLLRHQRKQHPHFTTTA